MSFIAFMGGRKRAHGQEADSGEGKEGPRQAKRRTASKGRRWESEGPREVQTTASKWPVKYRDQKYAYIRNHDDN